MDQLTKEQIQNNAREKFRRFLTDFQVVFMLEIERPEDPSDGIKKVNKALQLIKNFKNYILNVQNYIDEEELNSMLNQVELKGFQLGFWLQKFTEDKRKRIYIVSGFILFIILIIIYANYY